MRAFHPEAVSSKACPKIGMGLVPEPLPHLARESIVFVMGFPKAHETLLRVLKW